MLLAHALLVTLTLGILVAPLAADAQQPGKIPRIALLRGGGPLPDSQVEAFRQGLRELGYVEGQTIAIEWRFAEKNERLPDIAAELVRLQVDIIATAGTPAAMAAKRATSTIPIVMVTGGDAVGSGLVASLARPGGNVTGQSHLGPELYGKRLELLKEIVPGVSRVAVLSNPTNPIHRINMRVMEAPAQTLGVALQLLEVRGPDDFERVFQAATSGRAGALLVLDDPLATTHRPRIASLAIRSRLPAMGGLSGFAEAGGLINYGPNFLHLFRRAATYVDKILKGAKPADLPVEQPTKFELAINLRTAKALGLTIPQSVLFRADHVIQ